LHKALSATAHAKKLTEATAVANVWISFYGLGERIKYDSSEAHNSIAEKVMQK